MQPKMKGKIKVALVALIVLFASYLALNGLQVGKYVFYPYGEAMRLGLDFGGGVAAEYAAVDASGEDLDARLEAAAAVLRARLQVAGYGEATVARLGDGLRAELPAGDDARDVLEAVAASGPVEFRDADGNVLVGGEHFTSASAVLSDGAYVLSFALDEAGTALLATATSALVGDALAVYLNGEEFTAPSISEALTEGMGSIPMTQASTVAESRVQALTLALVIEGGDLPLDVEMTRVGAISAALGTAAAGGAGPAILIGFALALLFLILRYRLSGAMAALALVADALIALALLCELPGAWMTMWGVTGLLLGLMVAVGASVAVLERIRQELRAGRQPSDALSSGFRGAAPLVADLHIVVGLIAAVLFARGMGPIEGFSRALLAMLGTSLAVTFVLLRFLLRAAGQLGLGAGACAGVEREAKKRWNPTPKRVLLIACALVVVALVLQLPSFNIFSASIGIDLSGGTLTRYSVGEAYELSDAADSYADRHEVRLAKAEHVDVEQPVDDLPDGEAAADEAVADEAVADEAVADEAAQTVSGDGMTDLERVVGAWEGAHVKNPLNAQAHLQERHPGAEIPYSTMPISATLSGDMIGSMVGSLLLGLLCALIYLLLRFGPAGALSALVSLVADVLIALALALIVGKAAGWAANASLVAAALAVCAASVANTAALLNRARENGRRPGLTKKPRAELFEISAGELLGWRFGAGMALALVLLGLLVGGIAGAPAAGMLSVALCAGLFSMGRVSPVLLGPIWVRLSDRFGKGAAKGK